MTHFRQWLYLAALVTACLFASGVRAADPEKTKPSQTDAEKLDAILNQLKDLKTEMKDARTLADTKGRELEDRLRVLSERVERLEKSVDRATVTQRSSFYQPNPINPAAVGSGTIMLQNTWDDVATIVLNGKQYSVPPNQTVTLPNQPAGVYNYEVIANGFGTVRGPVTRNLDDRQKLLIYVYPMR